LEHENLLASDFWVDRSSGWFVTEFWLSAKAVQTVFGAQGPRGRIAGREKSPSDPRPYFASLPAFHVFAKGATLPQLILSLNWVDG
jgi:hypothetical protein